MPSSDKHTITTVLEIAEQIKPKSILDIGIGFGKWGFLLREYLEVWKWHDSLFNNANKFKWELIIDGIEIYEAYIKDLQRNIYDHVFVGDVSTLIDTVDRYDLIILGDIIEHFEKKDGEKIIRKCIDKANASVLIITPATFLPQNTVLGNVAEKHKSLWTKKDFIGFKNAQFIYTVRSMIVCINKTVPKFKCANNHNIIKEIIHRIVAYYQDLNINRKGIHNHDEGIFLQLYRFFSKLRQ